MPEGLVALVPSSDGKAKIRVTGIPKGVSVPNGSIDKESTSAIAIFLQFSPAKPTVEHYNDELILVRSNGIGNQNLIGARDLEVEGFRLLGAGNRIPETVWTS